MNEGSKELGDSYHNNTHHFFSPDDLTKDLVALVLRGIGENASSSGISIEPLDDTPLLIVFGVQADVAIAKSLGDDDGGLDGAEVAFAGLAGG